MYRHHIIKNNEILNSAILMEKIYNPLSSLPENIETLQLHKSFSIKDTELAIYNDTNNDTIYVVFRGTSDVEDVATDIKYYPEKYMGTKIHKGFLKAYQYIEDAMIYDINNIVKNDSTVKIIFCGHSLGGAIAQIAFYTTLLTTKVRAYNDNIFCITEGSPKVFTERYINERHDAFTSRAIRITSGDDIVPSLPPRTPILRITRNSYSHIGQHWNIGMKDYKGEIKEHHANKYLEALQKEVFKDE